MSRIVILIFGCMAIVHRQAIAGPVNPPVEETRASMTESVLPKVAGAHDQMSSHGPAESSDGEW